MPGAALNQVVLHGPWAELELVAARAAEVEGLGERLLEGLPYIWAELDHAVEEEMVVKLRDFMRRRTQLEIRDLYRSLEIAPAVGERMGRLMGWSPDRVQAEVEEYQRESSKTMAWRAAL